MAAAAEDVDINSVFDSVAQTEERLSAEGFREGFESGRREGAAEGLHLGYHRGAELGAELGFYTGVVEAWLSLGPGVVSEKARQSLLKVAEHIRGFPRSNVDNVDILALADVVRVSYRRACSLLKTNATYPEASKMSF